MNGYICFYKGKMASQAQNSQVLRQVKQAIRQPYAWLGRISALCPAWRTGEALSIEAARSRIQAGGVCNAVFLLPRLMAGGLALEVKL